MKPERQNKILEILATKDVETQEELSELLRKAGFTVTQATVSRDINELRIIKVPVGNGLFKYATVTEKTAAKENKLTSFIAESAARFDYAGNTVVIKCNAGTAQTLCMMLDKEKLDKKDDSIVGTLAGDDTILVIMRTEEDSELFCKKYNTH